MRRLFDSFVKPDPFIPKSLLEESDFSKSKRRRHLTDMITVSTAAWIGSAPLGLIHFSLITPVALIANLVLVPLAFFILLCSAFSILTHTLHLGFLGIAFNNMNLALVSTAMAAASFFSSIPGGHLYIGDDLNPTPKSHATLTILDIPWGGAANLIQSRNHDTILIDAASAIDASRQLIPFLRSEGIRNIDHLVLTHGDTHHIEGTAPLMNTISFNQLHRYHLPSGSPAEKRITHLPFNPVTTTPNGTPFIETNNIKLTTLHPHETTPYPGSDDRCIVLLAEVEGWRILFTSDAGFLTEKALLQSPEQLKADIWIKGRHGSDFSGLPEFALAVDPQLIIFTHSTFPEKEKVPLHWIDTMKAQNRSLMNLSQTGAITLKITPETITAQGHLTTQRTLQRPH